MKKLRIFYFALIVPILIFGQSREITGKVFDENNTPLPGANLLVTGSNNGGSTDFDGVFSFSAIAESV